MVVVSSSCIERYEDEVIVGPPQIAFLSSDTSFNKQYGDTLMLEAIIVDGENIEHEWRFENEIVGESNLLKYKLTEVGTFIFEYSARNTNGTFFKKFSVQVDPNEIEGISFSTTDSIFTKSIGEQLKIYANVLESGPVVHEWKVGDDIFSTSSAFEYNILDEGDFDITYKVSKSNAEFTKVFKLTARISPYGRWFVWQDREKYVLCLKDNENKVVAHHDGSQQFVIENYTGSEDQIFVKGAYFGYGDNNVQLEYYNIYNLGTHYTLNEKGLIVDAQVTDFGVSANDGWRGWYFPVNEDGNVRMVHFLETWDYAATYKVAIKGCLMKVSDDNQKIEPVFYDRCKEDGVRDHSDYEALSGQYFDFVIKNVKDMN
tara:strand:+ start:8577 stop:9692 length:1116 start_codon:yes stop_codon:yes gene_type:complete